MLPFTLFCCFRFRETTCLHQTPSERKQVHYWGPKAFKYLLNRRVPHLLDEGGQFGREQGRSPRGEPQVPIFLCPKKTLKKGTIFPILGKKVKKVLSWLA